MLISRPNEVPYAVLQNVHNNNKNRKKVGSHLFFFFPSGLTESETVSASPPLKERPFQLASVYQAEVARVCSYGEIGVRGTPTKAPGTYKEVVVACVRAAQNVCLYKQDRVCSME